MKLLILAATLSSLVLITGSQQLPQIPPTQPPQLPTLLCSAVTKWNVKLIAVVVNKTPNDAGSHEEWHQNFILVGSGPLTSSYQVKEFAFDPHDEIPDNAPPHTVAAGDLPSAQSFPNTAPRKR